MSGLKRYIARRRLMRGGKLYMPGDVMEIEESDAELMAYYEMIEPAPEKRKRRKRNAKPAKQR